ncbi:hypothetical protein QFC24_004094 [Naganishia onofrii]|uniref:Uncharacterized protein n=1 Tax=Naganishia onofrii TaxID=1851511 RepID=A0ACC2XI02_9TREE|nr:hypothetical protein QFC24_004094 [Naganishia onofrii]
MFPSSHNPSQQWHEAQKDRDELRRLLTELRDCPSDIKSTWSGFTFKNLTESPLLFLDCIDDVLDFLRLPGPKGEENIHIDKMVDLDPNAHAAFHFLASGSLAPYIGQADAEIEVDVALNGVAVCRGALQPEDDLGKRMDGIQQVLEAAKGLYSKIETISNKYWVGTLKRLRNDVVETNSSGKSTRMLFNTIETSTIFEYLQLDYSRPGNRSLWTRRTAPSSTQMQDGGSTLSESLASIPETQQTRMTVQSWVEEYFGPGSVRARGAPTMRAAGRAESRLMLS